jgi:dual specificity phosphatase 12
MQTSVDQIIPNLWVGNIYSAHNTDFLQNNNIKLVVNCTPNMEFTNLEINKIRIPVNDDLKLESNKKLLAYGIKVVDYIKEALDNNVGVLVHCMAGIQRSTSIVAIYLMKYYGFNLDESINYIKSRRPIAFNNNVNFGAALKIYEKKNYNNI